MLYLPDAACTFVVINSEGKRLIITEIKERESSILNDLVSAIFASI